MHIETARRAGVADLPDAVWYARWGVSATLTDEPALSDSAWASHARIHQYTGSVTESYGGKKLNIDRDLIDAPVAVVVCRRGPGRRSREAGRGSTGGSRGPPCRYAALRTP